jgi:hypothetical protein
MDHDADAHQRTTTSAIVVIALHALLLAIIAAGTVSFCAHVPLHKGDHCLQVILSNHHNPMPLPPALGSAGVFVLVRWLLQRATVTTDKQADVAKAETLVTQAARVSYEKTLRYGMLYVGRCQSCCPTKVAMEMYRHNAPHKLLSRPLPR